MIRRSHQTLW